MSTIAKGTLDAFENRAIEVKDKQGVPVNTEPEVVMKEEELIEAVIPGDADPREVAKKIYKDRKPGIISRMMKPRRGNVQAERHEKQINHLVIVRLTELKNKEKLNDLAFYRLIDRFCNDIAIKDQIKNLYMLEKEKVLTEVHFITYLKELVEQCEY